MIVGFDISSSVIGWTILDNYGKLVNVGHINLSKEKDFFAKFKIFEKFLVDCFCEYSFSEDDLKVYIEEPTKRYASGQSMAQTISKLQYWNGACCAAIFFLWHVKPENIHVSTARKLINVPRPKKSKSDKPKKKKTKEIVLQWVKDSKFIPEEKWAYKEKRQEYRCAKGFYV